MGKNYFQKGHTINELDQIIGNIEKSIPSDENDIFSEMLDYDGEDRIILSTDAKKEIDAEPEPAWTIKTKLPELDKLTGGFVGGNLVVISAPTGVGKTKLAETFTANIAGQNTGVCFFSFEMTNKELFERFGSTLPKFWLPRKLLSSSLKWLEKKVIEALAKSANSGLPVRAVVIDHLHFLFDLAKSQNASLELGSIVRILKKMALKWNIVVFLIAHTGMVKSFQKVDMGSIRDSSFISQEADFVLMLDRKKSMEGSNELYENQTTVALYKNRRTGKTGKFDLEIRDSKFVELSKTEFNKNEDISNIPFQY